MIKHFVWKTYRWSMHYKNEIYTKTHQNIRYKLGNIKRQQNKRNRLSVYKLHCSTWNNILYLKYRISCLSINMKKGSVLVSRNPTLIYISQCFIMYFWNTSYISVQKRRLKNTCVSINKNKDYSLLMGPKKKTAKVGKQILCR